MLKKIAKFLTKNKLTLSVAESVTGGLISDMITNIPGSSYYFLGGVTAYSNNVKIKILKVKKDDIKKYSAVSEVTAGQMAKGVKQLTGSDISIAVTGIAGPAGGTLSKPVGLVYIAIIFMDKIVTKKFNFKGSRLSIKDQAAKKSLKMLLDALKD